MKHRKKEFKNLRNFRNLLNLKKDYENKTKQLKSSIVSTRRYHAEIEKKKKTKWKLLWGKINSLQSSFIEFKNQFTNKFDIFKKKFLPYTDVSSKPKHSEFLTDINSKLSVVTENINA